MKLTAIFLVFLPFFALADIGVHDGSRRRAAHARHAHSRATASYKLLDKYEGEDFFNDFTFFTYADPTHGLVEFLDKEAAQAAGLAYLDECDTAVLAVDSTTWLAPGVNRKSVRITSNKSYDRGLFIADFAAVPYGCGAWPAYWTVGPNWPNGGEVDVFEVSHNTQNNLMTLHTSAGCNLNPNPTPIPTSARNSSTAFTGRVRKTSCASANGDNEGCGVEDTDARSAGESFNAGEGGVFAHRWDVDGIAVWHFARSEVPADIESGTPDPSSWPTPVAYWAADSCDMASHFYQHSIVFDITLCGDMGAATYGSSGCPGTCAQAVQDPTNFANAQFKINYVEVYDLE